MSGSASPSYHHGNLRTALLERAGETLAAEGADALTLRRLARELGVSHAAPGRHFRDRRALLDALALEGYSALNARLEAAVATTGADARADADADASVAANADASVAANADASVAANANASVAADASGAADARSRFSALTRAYLDFASENPQLIDLMNRPGIHPEGPVPEARRRNREHIASSLRQHERGDTPSDDGDRGAELIAFALVRGLAQLAAEDLLDGQLLDALIERAVDTIWSARTDTSGRRGDAASGASRDAASGAGRQRSEVGA